MSSQAEPNDDKVTSDPAFYTSTADSDRSLKAPAGKPRSVIFDEKFAEITRRNREEDRISNLPEEEQPTARVIESERRRKWEAEYASKMAAIEDESGNTSSTTTNTITPAPETTTTPDIATTTANNTISTTSIAQNTPPKRSLAQKFKYLFKSKHVQAAQTHSHP
ncbi:predicted protein [Pyrenophora tritici-repentis Pt-1C-BFP]|uniref:Uncharacterized protein n=2 Tax=Pyrenophora tritici-repentis TaxID=45151 RepID=A0A922SVR5_9PLEO|nr:uncharacterized protein PTRG_04479 [Pyrenophora tritici-repentis Pt-1C-BFP]EDU47386.1 predicted protein [Pyrenophora tritici-repentis Pt-1C-BFP]KAI1508557.1 hypothetical protein Ptr86124_012509 [Pyrenophora tritici-repentis]KAI1681208.1 hypothetical protein KJE20_10059 [Pyrenophora tritici-repentis]